METNKCPEFPFFGATYPDATCIDGKLFDLDSCEEDGLTSGGDYSCPFCKRDEFIEEQIENGRVREEVIAQIKFLDENYNLKNQKNDKDTQNFISSLENKNVFQRIENGRSSQSLEFGKKKIRQRLHSRTSRR